MNDSQRHVAKLGQLSKILKLSRLADLTDLDCVESIVKRLRMAAMLSHRLPIQLALAHCAYLAAPIVCLAHRILH